MSLKSRLGREKTLFSETKRIVEDIKAREASLQKRLKSRATWTDPEDVANYRRQKNIEDQWKRIDAVTKDRRCSFCCEGPMLELKKIVVMKEFRGALCRSCFNSYVKAKHTRPPVETIVERTDIRIWYRPNIIAQSRMCLGISSRVFAKRAGWSQAYQSQLENGASHTITLETFKTLYDTLEWFTDKSLLVKE